MKNLNFELLENYTEDDYKSLCEQADMLGIESLTEEEQYVVLNFKKYIGWFLNNKGATQLYIENNI